MAPLLTAGLALFEAVPTLLRLFGKDKPASVVEKVGQLAHTIAGGTTPEESVEKLKVDPELYAKFVAEADQRAMQWHEMYLKDIQDARERDVKLAQVGFRNTRANWLTLFAISLVVGLIALVVLMSNLDEWVKGVLLVALGRAWGYMDAIFNFEFGTTRQSRAKDDTIDKLSKGL